METKVSADWMTRRVMYKKNYERHFGPIIEVAMVSDASGMNSEAKMRFYLVNETNSRRPSKF